MLSLGPQHSFPLDRVPKFLASPTVETVVRQAVLTAPMFQSRWRWNLNLSLAVLRMRGGRKNPPAIQRMEADDLMAAVFPTLAACQENVAPGPLEIPDHPLVRQTLEDCLREAMDMDGLRALVADIEAGRVRVVTARHHRAVRAGPRDPQRPAVHVPGRRRGRGAAQPHHAAAAAACRWRPASWPGSTRPPSSGSPSRPRPTPATPTSCTTCCMTAIALRADEAWQPLAGRAGSRPPGRRGDAPAPGRVWFAAERKRYVESLF